MKIVVFTARCGETDELRPPAVIDPRARYLCFSDTPCMIAPYEWIPLPIADNPRLASRRIKVLADHPLLDEADATLWHDASYRLRRRVDWATRRLERYDLVAMRHPKRCRIEDEAAMVARYGYLPIEEANAIVARYRAAGYTDEVMTSNGLLARRVSPRMRAFNQAWWAEVQRWQGRDQLSLGYAAYRAGVRIGYLKGKIRRNPFARWREDEELQAVPA